MLAALYTARVVLQALGAEDFGIYSVTGGLVALAGFFNRSTFFATQRFLNYEMGQGGGKRLSDIFAACFTVHCIMAALLLVLSETAGVWLVRRFLIIPPERFETALLVYRFAVGAFAVNIVTSPYDAALVARERMNVYAALSVTDSLSRLAVALIVSGMTGDRLRNYGALLLLATLAVRPIYIVYCRKHFEECRRLFLWNAGLLRKIFEYSGWLLAGTATDVLSTHGVTIVTNRFFMPACNAARALALQVNSAVFNFSENFMLSVRPPVVQAYSRNEMEYMRRLVFFSSKLSFYLRYVAILPALLEMEYLLTLWLGSFPAESVLFTRLTLSETLVAFAFAPLSSVSHASGKIKYFQLIAAAGSTLVFALTYLLYSRGFSAAATYYIAIGVAAAGFFARLLELGKTTAFPVRKFLGDVVLRMGAVAGCSVILPMLAAGSALKGSLSGFVLVVAGCGLSTSLFFWLLGLNGFEKQLLRRELKNFIRRWR